MLKGKNCLLGIFASFVILGAVIYFGQNSNWTKDIAIASPPKLLLLDLVALRKIAANKNQISLEKLLGTKNKTPIEFGAAEKDWLLLNQSTSTDNCLLSVGALQLSIVRLFEINEYFYIPGSNTRLAKAFLKPSFATHHLKEFDLLIPVDITGFLQDLQYSTFKECNLTMAAEYKRINAKISNVPPKISMQDLAYMAKTRDELIQLGLKPVLWFGTLLGWYRECGVISHTTDLDLGVFYNKARINHMLTYLSSECPLPNKGLKLGRENDSLELKFSTGNLNLDVFVIYSTTYNNSYVSGMEIDTRVRYRWLYPALDENNLCSVDLLGYLFWVICDPEVIIRSDYGPHFFSPHHTDTYGWKSSGANVEEWGTISELDMHEYYDHFCWSIHYALAIAFVCIIPVIAFATCAVCDMCRLCKKCNAKQ